jgi:acylphosphatase
MLMKHIYLSGKVQGVSFRYHTFERAQKLGIKGWVRNLEDGRVEAVFVSDSESKLNELIEFMKVGPQKANVEKFEMVDVLDKPADFHEFSIRRDLRPTWDFHE